MATVDLNCKLLCASESAYLIKTNFKAGAYQIDLLNPNHNPKVPVPTIPANIVNQYEAIGLTEHPYVVVSDDIIDACLIGKTKTEIIVAFRGTLPPALTWDSFFDWLNDFLVVPKPNKFIPKGKVHGGFVDSVSALATHINKIVSGINTAGLPVYLTGHSKGGGMAPIAAVYLEEAFGLKTTQAVTFAGPNPGNTDFCNYYKSKYPNDIRYENYLDIVPLMPPTALLINIIETVSPSLPKEFKTLLDDMKKWDYNTVGNLMYIDSSGVAKAYTEFEAELLLPVRMKEIENELKKFDISIIAEAHHASCGPNSGCKYRYMQGACTGTVCKF